MEVEGKQKWILQKILRENRQTVTKETPCIYIKKICYKEKYIELMCYMRTMRNMYTNLTPRICKKKKKKLG